MGATAVSQTSHAHALSKFRSLLHLPQGYLFIFQMTSFIARQRAHETAFARHVSVNATAGSLASPEKQFTILMAYSKFHEGLMLSSQCFREQHQINISQFDYFLKKYALEYNAD
jgi:hypothetical protein